MVVFEVGVIVTGGVPLITHRYYDEISGDTTIRSGLFTAISSFTKELFADISEEIRMKKYVIHLKGFEWGGEKSNSLVYAVCSREAVSSAVKKALDRLVMEITKLDYPGEVVDSKEFETFIPIIDRIFGDLRFKPIDRAKKIFG